MLPRSSVLVYTNSRVDLELKYVYAKLGNSDSYQLCPVEPPTDEMMTTIASNTSIDISPIGKANNLSASLFFFTLHWQIHFIILWSPSVPHISSYFINMSWKMIRSNLTNIEGRWLDQSNHQGAGLRLQTACEEEQGGVGKCMVYGDGGDFFWRWICFFDWRWRGKSGVGRWIHWGSRSKHLMVSGKAIIRCYWILLLI